jgi:hypothetical protein
MQGRAIGELGGVLFSRILFLTLSAYKVTSWIFIVLCCVIWLPYLAIMACRVDRQSLQKWGFRKDNLISSFKLPTVAFILAVFIIFYWANLQAANHNTPLKFNWHLFVLLPLYPLYGLLQQFLIQSLVTRNVCYLLSAKYGNSYFLIIITIAISAIVFSLVVWYKS